MPHYYVNGLDCIQGILRGQKDVIWGLLSAIREIYPHTEPINQPYFHLTNINLPYSIEDLRKLELSLIKWIQVLGLENISKKQPVTILEYETYIRNGTLLCELAEKITRKPLHGVFKNPKTDSTALSNIRKACESLRKLPMIKQK